MQRVFAIDVLLCPSCGGRMKPIAEITDRRVAQPGRAYLYYTGVDQAVGWWTMLAFTDLD